MGWLPVWGGEGKGEAYIGKHTYGVYNGAKKRTISL